MVLKTVIVLLLIHACASLSVLKQLEDLDENIVNDVSDEVVINPSDRGKVLGDKLKKLMKEVSELKEEIKDAENDEELNEEIKDEIKDAEEHDGKGKTPDENEVDLTYGRTTDIIPFPENLIKEKRSYIRYNLWQPVNGKLQIPYSFDRTSINKLSEVEISEIKKVIEYINGLLSCHDKAWVEYDPNNPPDSSLSVANFTKHQGCYSYVGNVGKYLSSKPFQPISIGRGCLYKGIIAHEMMHAMGFHHEQSRQDRDQYVTIYLENVRTGVENNFAKEQYNYDPGYNRSKYDYKSVMHYSSKAFSKNGLATILPKDPSVSPNDLGQRDGLSEEDVNELNTLFNCPVATTAAPATTQAPAPQTTQAPAPQTTQAPETTTEAPETTTEAPETTTEAPETTTEAPETTTEAPETTTQAPETTTQAPETTTQAPETTTQAPETTTQAPETTTQTPETTTQAPETTTEAPETTTEAPATTIKPAVTLFECPFSSFSTRLGCKPTRNSYFYRWAVSSDCKDSSRYCRSLSRFGFCKPSSPFFNVTSANCRRQCNTCPAGSKSFITATRYSYFYLQFFQSALGSKCDSQEESFCISLDYMFSATPSTTNRLSFYTLSYIKRKREGFSMKRIDSGTPNAWTPTKFDMKLKCGSYYYVYGLTSSSQNKRVSIDNFKVTSGSC